MIRIYLAAVLLVSSSLSFALPFSTNQTKSLKFDCTDFSGKWKGTCVSTSDNEVEEVEVLHEQIGCEAIIAEGVRYDFGKENVTTENENNLETVLKITVDLNDDKNALVYDLNLDGKMDIPEFDYNFTVVGKGIMTIKDGKMFQKSTSKSVAILNGEETTQEETTTCSYEKQES